MEEQIIVEIQERFVKCFVCAGDGKETCTNPDHGFLAAISFKGANESACPCCGHNENHKMFYWEGGQRKQRDCEACNGKGKLLESEAEVIAEEYGFDNDFEVVD